MDQDSMVTEEVAAGKELVRQFDDSFPVKAAFWVKIDERSDWQLYLASDAISSRNTMDAYREVTRIVLQMRTPYLGPFSVSVIGGDHAMARAAAHWLKLYPDHGPMRFRDTRFGEVYIYPALHSVVAA